MADGGVTVGGEVKSGEAVVPYRAGLTLLEAIQARDGATDSADLKRVELIREGRRSQHNLRDPKKYGAENVPLQPNDRIVVPRAERPGF